ncbi:hypothetical protein PXK56_18210 [Phaeobacter gallaeciensis]|uniref:hypothetical protein n=1 Tax=Phaeobacter gallaeciensis TaxID=60890 RepID=UPI00238011B7|nr:hypothetical protein [Phaeobacter gallaeciensis]MDE4297121.1 hypothetical protein [Phaeobacter gallaeciensis]
MTKKATTPATDKPFMDQVEAVSDKRRKTMMAKLEQGFDDRAAFEATHQPANSSIQDKLKAYRKKMVLPGIAALSLAANVDPNFMNGSGNNANKRFNVYAIDKLADLLHGLNSGHIKNAVNKAVVQSLFRFAEAGVPFTGLAAQGAVSANLKVDKSIEGLLVRHSASPGTAPTQSSSTMNALAVLGAVKNIGSPKHPVWELTGAPVVDRLKEVA